MISKTVLKFDKDYLNHRYGLIHFNFFVQYARMAKIEVELVDSDDKVFIKDDHLIFSCTINNRQVIVDYADHATRNWQTEYPGIPYFKFQSNLPLPAGCIPLGPPIVGVKKKGTKGATMREYINLKYTYNYTPGQTISCKQMPNGAAVDRRNHVHDLLTTNFKNTDITYDTDQIDFWKAHELCLAAVCVPGATNNMVDRGQMELMGLGVCTVSPRLNTVFPRLQLLKPGTHYIQCQDDYSDLVEILTHLQARPDLCKHIGNNAQKFYDKHYAPARYWKWIMENLQ
jgi:hypothetical protein